MGHTHSASHCFLSLYLHNKLGTKAVYVNETFTKVCRLSEWTDYQNPPWVTKFKPATLGKKLNKEDVLSWAVKLLKQKKVKLVRKKLWLIY